MKEETTKLNEGKGVGDGYGMKEKKVAERKRFGFFFSRSRKEMREGNGRRGRRKQDHVRGA